MLDAQLDNNMKFSIDPHKVRKTRQSEILTHVEVKYPARYVWYDMTGVVTLWVLSLVV